MNYSWHHVPSSRARCFNQVVRKTTTSTGRHYTFVPHCYTVCCQGAGSTNPRRTIILAANRSRLHRSRTWSSFWTKVYACVLFLIIFAPMPCFQSLFVISSPVRCRIRQEFSTQRTWAIIFIIIIISTLCAVTVIRLVHSRSVIHVIFLTVTSLVTDVRRSISVRLFHFIAKH